jgi:hypothetical protein
MRSRHAREQVELLGPYRHYRRGERVRRAEQAGMPLVEPLDPAVGGPAHVAGPRVAEVRVGERAEPSRPAKRAEPSRPAKRAEPSRPAKPAASSWAMASWWAQRAEGLRSSSPSQRQSEPSSASSRTGKRAGLGTGRSRSGERSRSRKNRAGRIRSVLLG